MNKKAKQKKPSQFEPFFQFLKQLWENPKGKALLFFGFYLFFFIFIGVLYRTAPKMDNASFLIPESVGEKVTLSFKEIKEGNYTFTYQEDIDGVIRNLEGKTYNQMKEVKEDTRLYFLYSGISLERMDNVWQVAPKPFYIPQVLEEGMIEETLEQATFLSKTVYPNGESLYRFEISTTTLMELYQNEEVDLADVPNTIEVLESKEKEIQKITYDYSSYDSYLKNTPKKAKIEVSYHEYGKVKPFDIPS